MAREMINAFDCARCGQCCANQDLIQLTSYELFLLADHLGLSPADFFSRYCELGATSLNPMVHLYIRTNEMRCPFLDKNLCSVHLARPYACRAYPMRQLRTKTEDMKAFVRARYPILERTCSLFVLADGDELMGDKGLIIKQTIAYMVDEIYFNTVKTEPIDLTIPREVTAVFLRDRIARDNVASNLADPDGSSLENSMLPGIITMTLQARSWGAQISFVNKPSELSVREDARMGKYLLAKTDALSVDALRALVEGGRMDLGRSFVSIHQGTARISAIYASSVDRAAIGFQFELDTSMVERLSSDRARPTYIFFLPEDGSTTMAVGLVLIDGWFQILENYI